jgi:hypothetical protein
VAAAACAAATDGACARAVSPDHPPRPSAPASSTSRGPQPCLPRPPRHPLDRPAPSLGAARAQTAVPGCRSGPAPGAAVAGRTSVCNAGRRKPGIGMRVMRTPGQLPLPTGPACRRQHAAQDGQEEVGASGRPERWAKALAAAFLHPGLGGAGVGPRQGREDVGQGVYGCGPIPVVRRQRQPVGRAPRQQRISTCGSPCCTAL